MDLTEHIAAKSDQLDYQDFLGGERTFTVTEVRRGPSPEQPVEIVLAGSDRPWRPAKSMRRVLVAAWGADSEQYVGRHIELFGDATVKWAGAAVGGIRIKALSHIDKPLSVSLTLTRGKRAPFKVEPLAMPAPAADKTTGEVIPEDILATIQRITTAQEMNDYFAWLTEQGAPAHILNYVSDQITIKEKQA